MRTRCLFVSLLITLLPLSRAESAQSSPPASLQDALSGKGLPLQLKLKELNGEWRSLRVFTTAESSSSSASGGLGALFGGLGDASSGTLLFTHGQTLQIQGKTYLAAYRLPPKSFDMTQMMALAQQENEISPDAVMNMLAPLPTPDSQLSLTLLDVETFSKIEDIRPFDMAEAISQRLSSPSLATTAAILFPVFAQARAKARAISSLSNLKQLGLAAMMYSQDYDEVFPPMKDAATLKKVVFPYVKNESVFVQPGTNVPYRANLYLSRKRLAAIAAPAKMVLFYEAEPASDHTRGVCFADGHAVRVPEADWPRLKKASHIP